MIDKKGKLFGLVNIVDLIVVLLIIAVVAAIGYKLFSSKLNAQNGTTLTEDDQYCYVTVVASQVVPEIAEQLHEGDKLVANNAFTDAEIVSVKCEDADYVGVNSEGEAVQSKHPMWKDVTCVVKEKINPNSVILKVGDQEVRVGFKIILNTQVVETNSRIRDIEFKED
jgi:Tfp pilus assembly major pilin PilA